MLSDSQQQHSSLGQRLLIGQESGTRRCVLPLRHSVVQATESCCFGAWMQLWCSVCSVTHYTKLVLCTAYIRLTHQPEAICGNTMRSSQGSYSQPGTLEEAQADSFSCCWPRETPRGGSWGLLAPVLALPRPAVLG